jgi:hypothetical protein
MSGVGLRIGADLDKLSAALGRMSGLVQTAIARGLNEGGDLVRTRVYYSMRKQTGLSRLQSVTKRARTVRAFAVGAPAKSGVGPPRAAMLAYTVVFVGKPSTRPDEFNCRVVKGPGGGVTVWMWGVAHAFPRSFQQAYRGGLRMRLGGPRLPIRGFDGPNLAKEAVKDDVAETFEQFVPLLVPPMIEKRLAKLL